MPILNAPATLADFQILDLQTAISESGGSTCDSFYMPFCRLVRKFEQASKGVAASAEMLVFLCGFHLHADNVHDPLQPSHNVAALDANDLAFLKEIEPVVSNPELRARIQDLLWIIGKDARVGVAAINSYIESAKALAVTAGFVATERIERATRLAFSLNQKLKLQEIAQFARDLLFEEPQEMNFLSARLAGILLEIGWQDAIEIAVRGRQLAERAGSGGNFILRRRLLELGAAWYANAGNADGQMSMLLEHAESYVIEAELLAKKDNISFGQPAHLVECAVQAFRKLPKTKERVEELLRKRDEYNARLFKQMIPLSEDLKCDELAEHARQHVTRPAVHDAMIALAFISSSRDVDKLKLEVSKSNEHDVLRQLFGTTMFGATGRTAARASSSEGDDTSSPAFRAEMLRRAALGRSITVQGLIEPARLHILAHSRVRAEDIAPFIWNNPLVPPGREHLLVEGLLAGFRGNYIVSTHLLIPQLEHLVRIVLYEQGKRTSTYSSTGIEKENDLNTTLFDPDLVKILGENLVFDLQGLLVEPFGSNLRNEMAHGMRPYAGFFTVEAVYCWWLTLHLLCLPLKQVIKDKNDGQAQ